MEVKIIMNIIKVKIVNFMLVINHRMRLFQGSFIYSVNRTIDSRKRETTLGRDTDDYLFKIDILFLITFMILKRCFLFSLIIFFL